MDQVSALPVGRQRVQWRWDRDLRVAHPPGTDAVEESLRSHADAKGVVIVSPTDYGTCADLSAITEVCHRHNRVLLVDEAWDAHLPFHPDIRSGRWTRAPTCA